MTTAATVVTLGETMALVRTSEIGPLRHAHNLALGIGGAESNVAVGLARLGITVRWLGRVGADPLGERVHGDIRAEGVQAHVIVDEQAPTGLMLKERPTGQSTAVHYYRRGSAGSRLQPGDVPQGWVESADVLHLTGITPLLSESARETTRHTIERARQAGVTVSFDVNYRSALASAHQAAEILGEFAREADIVFGGPEELVLVTGADDAESAARALAAGGAEVVLKRGPDGAAVVTDTGVTERAGFSIQVIDTVGAGDAFVAGYLSARVDGKNLVERLIRGNACGALVCQAPGDWEAAPSLAQVIAFVDGGADPVRR